MWDIGYRYVKWCEVKKRLESKFVTQLKVIHQPTWPFLLLDQVTWGKNIP